MNNVRDFGAAGNGVVKDTAAIQRAIDAGGMVYFPPGVYLTGTIYLKSNGGLELAPGAVLKGSPDREDYNADDFCPQNRVFASEHVSGAHLVVALEQQNVTIRGGGRIDGNRAAFYIPPATRADIWNMPIEWRPGQMIFFCECEQVTIEDVELFDAPYWTCFLHGCEQVRITGLNVRNHPFTRNGDGIDIDCCRFVTVSDCRIDVGDDCITLRGHDLPLKKPRPCEYITITNCIMRTICNAFRIGVGNGTIRAALISNCIIFDSRNAVMLCSKYSPDKGVRIEDIQFDNLRIEAEKPIAILTNAHGRGEGAALNPIRNISFNHIRGTGCVGSVLAGYRPGDVSGIRFTDVELTYGGGERIDTSTDDYAEHSGISSPAAFWCWNITDLSMNGVRILWRPDAVRWEKDVILTHSPDAEFEHCRFEKGIARKE